jgi:Tfp pilus assembly protein PilZ
MTVQSKRTEKRLKEKNDVVLEYYENKQTHNKSTAFGLTKDVSLNGARILTHKKIEVGSEVKLILDLSKSRQNLSIWAKVMWINLVEEDVLYEIGVKFDHGISNTVINMLKHVYGKTGSNPVK